MKIDKLALIIAGGLVLISTLFEQKLAEMPYNYSNLTFYGETHMWCKILYFSIPVITVLLIVLSVVGFFFTKKYKKAAVITFLSLIIGPGLIVNSMLKVGWGRARPYQVIRDGGSYSAPWQPHFERHNDNSLPSGHVSVAMMLGVPLLGLGRRRLAFLVSSAFGCTISLVRMLQGGHYLSDVLLSMMITWIVALLVTYFVDKYLKYDS